MNETHISDLAHQVPLITRVILRLFARRINRDFTAPTILRLKETGTIDSRQTHEILKQFDTTQRGVIGMILGT